MKYYFPIQIQGINAFHMPSFCKASFGSLLAYAKVLILNKILLILPKILLNVYAVFKIYF